ncbi:hypothetical protein BDN70DRAFT_924346 [Pholiota conissans]|uniref:Uncharacterized protein n=1 Tax=Pholiota conissans TaxID=109636 RepID=A0A9P5YUJ8_9AGAR|nr:hypothetical protein BDN70DRAFT_924346 [Pholiota conissans]
MLFGICRDGRSTVSKGLILALLPPLPPPSFLPLPAVCCSPRVRDAAGALLNYRPQAPPLQRGIALAIRSAPRLLPRTPIRDRDAYPITAAGDNDPNDDDGPRQQSTTMTAVAAHDDGDDDCRPRRTDNEDDGGGGWWKSDGGGTAVDEARDEVDEGTAVDEDGGRRRGKKAANETRVAVDQDDGGGQDGHGRGEGGCVRGHGRGRGQGEDGLGRGRRWRAGRRWTRRGCEVQAARGQGDKGSWSGWDEEHGRELEEMRTAGEDV